ncbi:MAG TPA: MMPL family transporter [Solirubrobacteraceae bacterium]
MLPDGFQQGEMTMIETLGTWAARHRRWVISGWVVALVAVAIGSHALGGVYSDTLTIPGSTAQQGLDALRAHDKTAGGQSGQVVFVSPSGPVSAQKTAVEQTRQNLATVPHVLAVSDPLGQGSVSKDGKTAYATVNFDTNPQGLGDSYIAKVDAATAPARHAGLRVSYGGALGQAAAPKPNDVASELIGITVALIVLLAGFGSVIAGILPLASALIGVFTGLGLLGVVAAAISFGTSSPTLATMMGLGVGIDYALFLTTRHRQQLIDGHDTASAIRATMAGSGRSIVIAATTVVIAMLGLYASGIAFIGKLGLAAAITVAVAALAALTLVPALLAVARDRIDRWHVRTPVAEPSRPDSPLHRYTARLERHPWRYALSGICVLLILAIPVLSIRVGHVGPGSEPTSYSERQAFDAIDRGFGAGANGPLTIVVQLPANATDQQRSSLEQSLPKTLSTTPGVASVSAFQASSDGKLLIGKVVPKSGPESDATASLVTNLQDDVLPAALQSQHATGYVTGTTAATIDFQKTVSSRLPIIIGVVLLAAFLLLLASFRSLVLALKAALLNLLSIGAAYGILVAVFQWGWGASLLGVSGTVPIESYVPMIIFAIVFGLSMDYEVFLLSRIREHWVAEHDNRHSVAEGLSQTARVISCAALIMASVFFAFLLSSSVVIKMLALGLGASVIIDATLIRLLIVPSLMFVFDRANWWIPHWLDRILPRLEPEPVPAGSAHIPEYPPDPAGMETPTSAAAEAGGER